MSDAVNHPSHYTGPFPGVECIDFTRHMTFCAGNAFKYIWRHESKGGTEDLRKAIVYLKWANEDGHGPYLHARAGEICGELFVKHVQPITDKDCTVFAELGTILCGWFHEAAKVLEAEIEYRATQVTT